MFLIEHIVVAIKVCKAYHPFHGIRKFHIETVIADSGDHAGKLLTDMTFHELNFLRFIRLTFCLIREPLPRGCPDCNFRKDLRVVGNTFFCEFSVKILLDDPMDLKIRVSADR